jgi:hypothetical protein
MKFVKKYENYYEGENQDREGDEFSLFSVGGAIRSLKKPVRQHFSNSIRGVEIGGSIIQTFLNLCMILVVYLSYKKYKEENPDANNDIFSTIKGMWNQRL